MTGEPDGETGRPSDGRVAVRPARTSDLEFLAALSRDVQQQHAEAFPHLFKPADPGQFGTSFFEPLLGDPNACIFIAERAGKQVGFLRGGIVLDPETPVRFAWERLHCKYIAIAPEQRGHGAGHALIGAAVEFAKTRGIATITGDVWSFNDRMRRFLVKEAHEPLWETFRLDVHAWDAHTHGEA